MTDLGDLTELIWRTRAGDVDTDAWHVAGCRSTSAT
jgi:hypothetical protein